MTPEIKKYIDEALAQGLKDQVHDGNLAQRVNLFDIFGQIQTVDAAPTATPTNIYDQLVIYNGDLYYYNFNDNTWYNAGSAGSTPGGSDTSVQFNDGGNFGGTSEFTYDDSGIVKTLEINDGSLYGQLTQGGVRFGNVGSTYDSYYGYYSSGHYIKPTTTKYLGYLEYFSVTTTTNASPTTINGAFYGANDTQFLQAYVVGRRTGGSSGSAGDSAAYVIQALYKGGSIIGSINTVFSQESQAGWDATFAVGVGVINVQVTGAVNNDVYWTCNFITQQVSP